MKRVVLIRSNPVNPDPAVEKVLMALVNDGYTVTVLAWDRSEEYKIRRTEKPGAEIIRFGLPGSFAGGLKKNLKPLVKFEKNIYIWLKENRDKYDIIHAFDLDTGIMAQKAAKKYNKKLVYHILDYYAACRFKEGTVAYKIISKIEGSVINSADAVVLCSEKRLEQIAGTKPKRMEFIHNTPPESMADKSILPIESCRVKIAYAGILAKGRLIEEMLEVVKEDDRLELHIAGFGQLEELVENCSRECERIVYYGKLPYNKVLSLEANCDVMTAIYDPDIANHRYAAPNKLYEAMMLGRPVIMCCNTGWDEVLRKEDTGVLIECSKEGLKKGFSQLIDKKSEWKSMGENARRLYEEKYSWDVMRQRLVELYKGL